MKSAFAGGGDFPPQAQILMQESKHWAVEIFEQIMNVLTETFGNQGVAIIIVLFAIYFVWSKHRIKRLRKVER